jgi:transposase
LVDGLSVSRFARGKQVSSYLGLIPSEHSSSKRRRLGSISKQGSPFLRMLLVESAQNRNSYRPESGLQSSSTQQSRQSQSRVGNAIATT